jgi:hypothetical protein
MLAGFFAIILRSRFTIALFWPIIIAWPRGLVSIVAARCLTYCFAIEPVMVIVIQS